jgi:hypothetical protein
VDAADGGQSGRLDATTSKDAAPSDATSPPDIGPVQWDGGPCVTSTTPLSTAEQQVASLPADSWWAAPATALDTLCGGCAPVITAWSGGALDPVNNRMLVFGGGHVDSADNSLYAFDLSSLSWSRLSPPSDPGLMNADPLPDGRPVSRHTYDGVQFLSHQNRFFAWGGSRWQDGFSTGETWVFDVPTHSWTDLLPSMPPAGAYQAGSVYVPSSHQVFVLLASAFYSFDPDGNAWTKVLDLGFPPLWPRYANASNMRGALDSKRGLLWFFGGGMYFVYDPASRTVVTDSWVTTGGSTFDNSMATQGYPGQQIRTGGGEVITASAPGVDDEPIRDVLVAYAGGAPWVLDLSTKAWSQSSATGGPQPPPMNGTYGRWRYVARTNAFVLVNSSSENVWFYKHTALCGP